MHAVVVANMEKHTHKSMLKNIYKLIQYFKTNRGTLSETASRKAIKQFKKSAKVYMDQYKLTAEETKTVKRMIRKAEEPLSFTQLGFGACGIAR